MKHKTFAKIDIALLIADSICIGAAIMAKQYLITFALSILTATIATLLYLKISALIELSDAAYEICKNIKEVLDNEQKKP